MYFIKTMRSDIITSGGMLTIGGILFLLIVKPEEMIWIFAVGFTILSGILIVIYGLFATGVLSKKKQQMTMPDSRFNKKCKFLTMKHKMSYLIENEGIEPSTTRHFCSARKDVFGNPKPIDYCLKKCPDYEKEEPH